MNIYGSYKKLLDNSKSAMLSAVEIYNKPRIEYRDETFIILFINAWELLLKAILSKNKIRIYYPKERNQPYRTFSLMDALAKTERFFPVTISYRPVAKNIELMNAYRDSTIHFYNALSFGSIIYALGQTGIKNYKDVIEQVFGKDLAKSINWHILPLGTSAPVDPISYLGSHSTAKKDMAVQEFIEQIRQTVEDLDPSEDLGRLLTVFEVRLQSTKKISKADFSVAVSGNGISGNNPSPVFIHKPVDPNISHPLRQKDILSKLKSIDGYPLSSYTFLAIRWKYDVNSQPKWYWGAKEGTLSRYSYEFLTWLKRLTSTEIAECVNAFKTYNKKN